MLHQLIIALLLVIPTVCVAGLEAELSITKLISEAEKQYEIPKGLLLALAEVESSLNPYAINILGQNLSTDSLDKAAEIINQHLKKGYSNIDIGVMQVNYHWHGHNFDSIAEMLSPKINIQYGAKLLKSLYKKYKSWHKAAALYYSNNPVHYQKYTPKVLLAWVNS